MKVFLDTSSLQGESRFRGIGRYIQFLKELEKLDDVTIITNNKDEKKIVLNENKKKKGIKKIIKNKLPQFLIKGLKFFILYKAYYQMHHHPSYKEIPNDIDIIHAPANYFPYSLRNHPAKKVVSILDTIPLVDNGKYNTEGFQWFIKKSFGTVKYADKVITISNYSKQDIIRYLNVPEDKIEVIPLGFKQAASLNTIYNDEKLFLKKEFGVTGPFLLYVGAIEERKNIRNLLLAFSKINQINLKLVLVGKKNENSDLYISFSEELGIKERICFTGYIEDALLPIFYKNAFAFIFPSYYEGFGLPVLEAMSFGLPVITSNVSSLPEVTGDSAILVDPTEVNSITQGINRLIDLDSVGIKKLINKGFERVEQFKWEDTLLKTKGVYSHLEREQNSISNLMQ